MLERYVSRCESDTEKIASLLSRRISRGLVALYGDLGAGKTVFSRGFIQARFPDTVVSSPSFTVLNQYGEGADAIYHADLYRIASEDDLESTGFYDLPDGALILCEWSEKLPDAVKPDHRITIRVTEITGEREILWETDQC